MNKVQNTPAADTRIKHVMLNDVYAELEGGGSVSVEEIPEGQWATAGQRMDDCRRLGSGAETALILELDADLVSGAVINTVNFHPDEGNRLSVIQRARQALDDAETALLACGYVDYSARKAGAA